MSSSSSTPAPSPKGIDLYARFAFAGAVCCAVTHGALTPVDVVKTRIQLDPVKWSGGMGAVTKKIIAEEGMGGLLTGIGPTFAGYFVQGALKFGGYEFWKKTAIDYYGIDRAREIRLPIYLISSAMAEFVADVALCPLEATRIRLVSQPTFANGLVGGFLRLLKEEGVLKGFYSGFIPILFKQVPYTMAKFAVQETSADAIYVAMGKTKSQVSNATNTGVYLASGIIAGTAAAIISQPADTLLSKVNKSKGAEGQSIVSRLFKMAVELGPAGLFTGLGPRIVMVASLTAGQFAIYGDIKRVLGATGGAEIVKVSK